MNDYRQPTSAPYSADNLAPNDELLIRPLEFGTDTTLDTGDLFVGNVAQVPVMSINARVGMLENQQLNADAEVDNGISGSTFLLPEWSSYPRNPVFGPDPDDPTVIVMYAHVLRREVNLDDPEQFAACLVLAGESFVGDVSARDSTAVGLSGDTPMSAIGEEGSAFLALFAAGSGNAPSSSQVFNHWGSNLYFKIVMIGDDSKETDATFYVSRDGITWTFIGETQISADGEAMRRVGLGTLGGTGVAWLDWVRIYSYPAATNVGGLVQPLAPLTGTRRFG